MAFKVPGHAADKWTIIDIKFEDCPTHFVSRILSYARYTDVIENEHLYSVTDLMNELPKQHLRSWSEDEMAFLRRIKLLMEEADAFYFRIIDIQ